MVITKEEIKRFLRGEGASLVGVAGIDRFNGAPVGHRPEDLLPGTRSVISIGVKLPEQIVAWDGLLAGSEIIPEQERWNVESGHWYARCGYEAMNIKLEQLGLALALYLETQGYPSLFFPATYAHHAKIMEAVPGYFAPFSHRHAAVRAGLGEFGYSNLVVTPEYGPRVRFMSVLTTAQLDPDPLLKTPVCRGEDCLACIRVCGLPSEGRHAITPITSRNNNEIFLDMPSKVDKEACYSKYEGKARCWGKCVAACPVGRRQSLRATHLSGE